MNKVALLAIKNRRDYALVSELIERQGYVVEDFIISAKSVIKNSRVDLIITDAFFGAKYKSHIRALKKSETIFLPAILLLQSTEASDKWFNPGVDDIIRIPISKNEFLSRISNFELIREQSKTIVELSEKTYKTIFESTGTATMIVDAETKIVLVNKECSRVFGYGEDELNGQSWTKYASESSLKKMLHHHKLRRTHPEKALKKYEVQIMHKNGTPVDVILDVSMIPDTGQSIVSMLDISQRKQAIKENKTLIQAIEQSPLAIVITNNKGEIEYVNKMFTASTQYSFHEVQGKLPRIFNPGHLPEKNFNKMWDLLKTKNTWTGEYLNRKKNREYFWEEASISALSLEDERVSNYVLIKEDISEKKQTEQELIKAKEKAEESDRLKSAFLSNMSHEIRTPMNGILGFTQLLKEPQLTGEQKDGFIEIIEKSGQRMLNTINDIVDISKIEAGQVKVVNSEIEVSQILNEQYRFFLPEAKSKGLKLRYKPNLSVDDLRLVTDQHKLIGILTNLIKNAIKYTEKGNITIGCSVEKDKEIKVLEFYVKDTGIGIPANRIEAIFNRFEQADIQDTRVFEGSGLGLAISKSYAEMLGGDIRVISEEGKGSTFYFYIPYQQQSAMEDNKKESTHKEKFTPISNLSVIVAEDDEISQLFLKTILKKEVKSITFTSNGKEAIKKCQENPDTDIILMDIKMPDMNGYKATREIRKFNPDVIIIAQTSFGMSGDREKALAAGCDEYISKPINKEVLFEMIRACLAKKEVK